MMGQYSRLTAAQLVAGQGMARGTLSMAPVEALGTGVPGETEPLGGSRQRAECRMEVNPGHARMGLVGALESSQGEGAAAQS